LIGCPKCNAPNSSTENACVVCGAMLAAGSSSDPLFGVVIAGKYKILSVLGEGATGRVYRAENLALKSHVALKLLHDHRRNDEALIAQFKREAKTAGQLSHPNTVDVLDYGTDDEQRLYVAMELAQGDSLAVLIKGAERLELTQIVRIMRQVLGALEEAHNHNIVHGDLKPDNIIVENRMYERDVVKVLDFGAVPFDTEPGRKRIFGTPEYMSPEQAKGEKLDGRADLYSVGVILYQIVTNTLPFTGDHALAVATQQLHEAVEPPSVRAQGVHIDARLEGLIMSCLAKERNQRPESAQALSLQLKELLPDGALDTTGRVKMPVMVVPRSGAGAALEDDAFGSSHKRQTLWMVAAGVAALLVIGVGLLVAFSGEEEVKASHGDEAATDPATNPPAEAVALPSADASDDVGGTAAGPVDEAVTDPVGEEPTDELADVVELGAEDPPEVGKDKKKSHKRADPVAKKMLAQAQDHFKKGNLESAAKIVEQVLKRDPGNRGAQSLARKIAKARK